MNFLRSCGSLSCDKAAEAGNLDEFVRLYQFDNTRLSVQDGKGRTVAHQASARNKINILLFIHEQGGGNDDTCTMYRLSMQLVTSRYSDLNCQDNVGNTPLHSAVENDSFDAIEFLLRV